MMRKVTLSSNYLGRIIQVFNDKHWNIADEDDASLFSRYCERIGYLKENDKKDLILGLTERYLWIQDNAYIEHLISALERFVDSEEVNLNNRGICVLPLVDPQNKGKPKSSYSVAYDFNNVKLRYNRKLANYRFEVLSNENDVVQKINYENNVLVLVDDFIGTGETAVKGINDILSKVADRNRIYVIALVAQNVGIEAIESLGIRIYADVIRFKGISDYYKDEELIEKINLMEAIERKLAIKRKYRFGYGASEALVTMKRTPNNTFPVFWEENDRANKAPFPRF